jgi:CRP/FNR family cyclic AMP-dependent transcriptional regulator
MAQFALNPHVLKNVPLFSSFSDQQLTLLLPAVQHRRYPRGSYVIRAGEETDALYIILAGKAKVLIPDDDGNEVILSVIGPNEFFGEMGLLDDQPRSASVETMEPCEMLRITRSAFLACLKDNFDAALVIIRNLVKRLREADRKIESLALIDVYGRVARLLIEMAQPVDGQWIIEKAPPKQEIARMIGASREMVSRVVKDLHDKGVIRAEKRKIFVLDRSSMGRRSSARQSG